MFNKTFTNLVLAISTGIDAAVVTRPEIIELTKCKVIFSSKYPERKFSLVKLHKIAL